MSELFHEQSCRWLKLAQDHVTKLFQLITTFFEKTISIVINESDIRQKIEVLLFEKLDIARDRANEELQKLLSDERRQPITYNHYYTDNIERARSDKTKKIIEDWEGKFHAKTTPWEKEKLTGLLQTRLIVNMDDQACAEALLGLNAYYKVR